MPSNTYHNLNEEKKQKLILAAIHEFSRVPFVDASINHIIHEAEISRGSFYMYFKNKDELFQYILYTHKEKFYQLLKLSLIENHGDIRTSFISLFRYIIDYIKHDNIIFFKNVFLNLNYQNKNYIVPGKEDKDPTKNYIKELTKYVDGTLLHIQYHITLEDIFELFISTMIPYIILFITEKMPLSTIEKKYHKKINLICFGIYRKEEKKC